MRASVLIVLIWGFSLSTTLQAKTASGCFKASDSCEAYQSFRKKTNPSQLHLEQGGLYPVLEINKKKSAYRIFLKGAKKPKRWVAGRCGEVLASCDSNVAGAVVAPVEKASIKKPKRRTKSAEYLLALSWQPSFCETHSRKKECRNQTRNRYDASHWSLHGLWPQPRANAYCGVNDIDKGIDRNKKWHLLAPVKLSQKTATELAFVMPAVVSNLHRHEWIKHGTCYGTDADQYYSDAIALTKQVNESIVGKLFNQGLGKRVSLKQVRQHFDKAFGKGAGAKVDMRCDRKGRISELWINLKGTVDIAKGDGMASLLKKSIRAGSSCRIGVIDKANH